MKFWGLVSLFLVILVSMGLALSQFELPSIKIQAALTIDGFLTDSMWEQAAIAKDFIQYEPHRGEASATKTEALVLYDEEKLYVAFRLWEAEPIAAQLTRRDADLFQDDAVILILDTHYDRRSGYYFMTNALATQSDGRIADDGRTVDNTWDAPWECAAQKTDDSWSVEISIPFTFLKYGAGDSVTWGINFGRTRRRNLETSYWAGPLDNQFRVSQSGALVGLMIKPPVKRYQIIPYGLSRFQDNKKEHWEAGIDIRYAITPQISVYGTGNPDFATIEADQEQINLTRFELALAEKRQFFLEGNELFGQRIRTFYSRRIPDITVGGKILGKQGAWTFAGIAARSKPTINSTRATYAVMRVQKDVLGSSNVALVFANRTLSGNHQGSASMDATLFFTKSLGMTAQLINSYGDYNNGTWAYFLRPAYDSPTTHFHVRYTHMGDHVAENINAIGFIRDDNRRELDSAFEKKLWFKNGFIERTHYNSNYNIYWGQNGGLRSWQIDQSMTVESRNRFSFEWEYTGEFKRFEKDFDNWQTGIELGYNTREFESVEVGYKLGKNFDSDFYVLTAEAGYKVSSKLSIEYELQRLSLRPDPESESTWIHLVKANQFFTRDLYVRIFFQSNSVINRKNIQTVFVYRYQPPFGTIQLAYQRGTAEFGQKSEQGNTLFIKLTHVL